VEAYFRAFTFVDRITGLVPGARILGRYTVPAGIGAFPASLVAEATGQLAAWAAMAAVDFTHRPVAGIAGAIELLSAVRPGQVLELSAELESVDTETVGYSGSASADGMPVLRLLDCVGPMMPVEEFDDPRALRDRFHLLNAGGATPGAFGGLPELDLQRDCSEPAQSASAVLRVPVDALLFGDHFPRRPVFPGTLLMHANLQTAAMLTAGVPCADGLAWVPRTISDVKLRTFIAPGETLRLEAKRIERSDGCLNVAVESRSNGRLIGSAGIQFGTAAPS
jgi:3-hydroxymyristoyl/3-hydroxydecanoyl-(acyl carrier protein) dehydratase